jgi:hypothetical protein
MTGCHFRDGSSSFPLKRTPISLAMLLLVNDHLIIFWTMFVNAPAVIALRQNAAWLDEN